MKCKLPNVKTKNWPNKRRTDGRIEIQTHSPARQSVNEKYLKIQIETKTKLKWYKNETKTKKALE